MKSLSRFSMIHQPFRNRTSAVSQSCIGRFSAVFVGIPIGVSLPQIASIGHLSLNVASASVRATCALALVRSNGGVWNRPRVVRPNRFS
jgi:hypothetical protein